MIDHMGAMMGGMALLWLLFVILIVLGIAALVKHLFTPRRN